MVNPQSPLAVEHDLWWPEDSEKVWKAMKEIGSTVLNRAAEYMELLNGTKLEAGTGSAFLTCKLS